MIKKSEQELHDIKRNSYLIFSPHPTEQLRVVSLLITQCPYTQENYEMRLAKHLKQWL